MALNDFESNLVTFLDQHYQLSGELLTAERAFKEFGIPVGQFKAALDNTEVREALVERGIIFERFERDDWTKESLTPMQLMVANQLLDLTDTRTNKKKLQDLGVSTLQYNAWLKDPVFKNYMHKRAEQMIGDNKHEADAALLDKIRSGDLKAIAYYNEWTGRFVQQRGPANQVDVGMLVIRVLEIIEEEVEDPETLVKIGERLRGLIAARNTANALIGAEDDAIVVPEVIQVREVRALG